MNAIAFNKTLIQLIFLLGGVDIIVLLFKINFF